MANLTKKKVVPTSTTISAKWTTPTKKRSRVFSAVASLTSYTSISNRGKKDNQNISALQSQTHATLTPITNESIWKHWTMNFARVAAAILQGDSTLVSEDDLATPTQHFYSICSNKKTDDMLE